MKLHDLHGRLTLTVAEAADLVEIGRDAAYDAVERGEIPAVRVGRRIVVPTHALLDQVLRIPADAIAQILGIPPPESSTPGPSTGPGAAQIVPATKQEDSNHGHPGTGNKSTTLRPVI